VSWKIKCEVDTYTKNPKKRKKNYDGEIQATENKKVDIRHKDTENVDQVETRKESREATKTQTKKK